MRDDLSLAPTWIRSASDWRSTLLFWASLLVALSVVALAYRTSVPPSALCVGKLVDARSHATLSLPLHVAPGHAGEGSVAGSIDAIIVLQHRFTIDIGDLKRPALYVSGATPFLALQLNARDLTPGTDLQRRDRRDPGPHLYALAKDALVAGENLLTLRLPVSTALGGANVGTVCIGDESDLRSAWRTNWWRQIGIPSLYLALFTVLAMTSLALSRLDRGAMTWYWYAACLSMMACRTMWLVVADIPGGLNLWRAIGDMSTLLLVFSTYRLMTLFWGVGHNRWPLAWAIVAAALRLLAIGSGADLAYPLVDMLYWLSVGVVALILLIDVSARVRHAPAVERRGMQWVLLFAIACGMLEVIPLHLDTNPHLYGVFVSGCAAVALMFGFLLIRRSLLGTALLTHATRRFGQELDRALLSPPEHSASLWNELSSDIATSERQQFLHDIDAGFGSRMLTVLEQIRSEHPHSRLNIEIQRALLDLRLMIDAMDDTSQSIRGALATLRQRMQGPLAAAGIQSTWDIAGVSDLQIDNRRKLMELFRCLEELLSNVVQHAHATEVLILGRSNDAQLILSVQDNGRGFSEAQANGRGLRNVRMRLQMLEGSVTFHPGDHQRGSRIELSVPRI
jgi:signal transduction histidine kinase